jgi:hypothetical protein
MSPNIETIEDTLAYKLGMLAAHKLAMEALANRAVLNKRTEKMAEANECIAIIYDVLNPLWMDASREASGLNVAALEKRA